MTACCFAVTALVFLALPKAWSVGFGTLNWQRAILKAQQERDYGESPRAIAKLQEAWGLAQQLGKNHPFYTITLRHLSDSAWRQRKFQESRAYAMQEFEILKSLGPDYQDLVPIFTRLADIDLVENKLDSAAINLQEALRVKDKAMFNLLGRAEIIVRQSVVELARGNQKEYERLRIEAEQEWIATKVAKPGTCMSDYGFELGSLSLSSDKKVAKPLRSAALYFTRRGLAYLQKQRFDNLSIIHAYERLADVYGFLKRDADRLAVWKQSANVCTHSKNLTVNEISITLCRYGKVLVETKNYTDAIPFLEQCMPFARRCDDQNLLTQAIFLLQFAYLQTNRVADALTLKNELINRYARAGMRQEAAIQKREIDALAASMK
jgi:tetratricopeptide (TPR) repeat protein